MSQQEWQHSCWKSNEPNSIIMYTNEEGWTEKELVFFFFDAKWRTVRKLKKNKCPYCGEILPIPKEGEE